MEFVEILTNRDTYSPKDAIKATMTVGELISYLEDFEDETPVVLNFDDGYTYGQLLESRIVLNQELDCE